MLRIRLQRSGRRKRANYRIVVAEHSAPIKGRYVDLVGSYDPLVDKHGLVFDLEKIQNWVKQGAKPTNTLARLLKGAGVADMDQFIVAMVDQRVKNPKEVPEAPAPAPAAPAPEVAEAPTAEAPEANEAKQEEVPAEALPAESTEPEAAPTEESSEATPSEADSEEKSE